MYVPLNCVIIDGDAGNRQELAGFLRPLRRARGRAASQRRVAAGAAEPVGCAAAGDRSTSIPAGRDAPKDRAFAPAVSAINFFVMSQLLDATLLMEAMHLGIREFIPLPMSEEKLTAAIERVAQSFGMGKKARIIHVIPTIGGCGSTTVACNVAAALAKIGTRPCCSTWTWCAAEWPATSTTPALHHRRRDGFRRETRQAAARQCPDDSPEQRAGDPGPAGTAGRHAAREPAAA